MSTKNQGPKTGDTPVENSSRNTHPTSTSELPKKKRNDVGYSRPPRDHQFKPGQSGNPKGRPKGSKNEATILRELFGRKVVIKESGKTRRATLLEAIYFRIAEDALKGNIKSAAFTLNRYGSSVSREFSPLATSSEDREVLDAYIHRVITDREGEE